MVRCLKLIPLLTILMTSTSNAADVKFEVPKEPKECVASNVQNIVKQGPRKMAFVDKSFWGRSGEFYDIKEGCTLKIIVPVSHDLGNPNGTNNPRLVANEQDLVFRGYDKGTVFIVRTDFIDPQKNNKLFFKQLEKSAASDSNFAGQETNPNRASIVQRGEDQTISSDSTADKDINASTDIVGLNLQMGIEQVKKQILSHNPKIKATKLTSVVQTEYYKENYFIGYYFDIENKVVEKDRYSSNTKVFDSRGEFIKVISGPGLSDVLGILRYKGYKKGNYPTRESIIKSLIDKYGEPSEPLGPLRNNLVWYSKDSRLKIFDATPERTYCTHGIMSRNDTLLSAGINVRGSGTAKDVFDSTGINLITSINNGIKFKKENVQCGVVLSVHLNLSDNWDYISSITESITNHDKMSDEYINASEEFWLKDEQARDAKLKGDSTRKPDI